jgi:hypothetical protein
MFLLKIKDQEIYHRYNIKTHKNHLMIKNKIHKYFKIQFKA